MTPKEKASDLMRKFTKENRGNKTYNEKYCNGIKLALICVDEILDTKPLEKDYEYHGHRGREVWYIDKTDYWLSVKHELSLL